MDKQGDPYRMGVALRIQVEIGASFHVMSKLHTPIACFPTTKL